MTADTTVELHHLLEGSEDAPVLVLANSLGTSLNVWDEQAEALPSALPTLVVAGPDDPAAPPEHGGLIRDPLPDAQLVIAPRHDIWPTSSSPRRSRKRCSHTSA